MVHCPSPFRGAFSFKAPARLPADPAFSSTACHRPPAGGAGGKVSRLLSKANNFFTLQHGGQVVNNVFVR